MRGFWQRTGMFSGYKSIRQVDQRNFRLLKHSNAQNHIVCDIDKTYLETKFETVLQLIQTAMQAPERKQTVVGATDVLKFARWGDPKSMDLKGLPVGLHFVSSSPPQMRSALEIKLSADGLDWDSDTFKDQAYNLLKGKVGLLRNHAAYKTLAIFGVINQLPENSKAFLIGDNAELDPYIYAGVFHYLSGNLDSSNYLEYVRAALPEGHPMDEIRAATLPRPKVSIESILIRKAPGYQSIAQEPLTNCIQLFDDYFQAALILLSKELIPATCLKSLVFRFHNIHAMPVVKIHSELIALYAAVGISEQLQACVAEILPELSALRETTAMAISSLNWQRSSELGVPHARDLLRASQLWLVERERMREQRDQ